MISEDYGEPVAIIDVGSSNELFRYNARGESSCVAQATTVALLAKLHDQTSFYDINKTYNHNETVNFLKPYIDVNELFRLSVDGMGAAQLSNHITSLNSNLSVKVWHTAMKDGYILTGRTKRNNADINIVADEYHAHAVVPLRIAHLVLLAHNAKMMEDNPPLTDKERANV